MNKQRQQNTPHNYEYVKQKFEERKFKLVSDSYKNLESPLDYLCTCGKLRTITFQSVLRGRGECRKCKNKIKKPRSPSVDYKKTIDARNKIEAFANQNGAELIDIIKIKRYL